MSSIRTRLNNARAKLMRRGSAASTATARSIASSGSDRRAKPGNTVRKSVSLSKLPEGLATTDEALEDSSIGSSNANSNSHSHSNSHSAKGDRLVRSEILATSPRASVSDGSDLQPQPQPQSRPLSTSLPRPQPPSTSVSATTPDSTATSNPPPSTAHSQELPPLRISPQESPVQLTSEDTPVQVTLEEPTPVHPAVPPLLSSALSSADNHHTTADTTSQPSTALSRRQSVVANTDAPIINTLLASEVGSTAAPIPIYTHTPLAAMLHRKIWVKRPNASATLVQIREDDLVDDVRDMILKKYANSLGRNFDAPDVILRIVPRDAARGQDRTLGPEEEMCRTLDAYFPGGQHVTEALIIDVPQRRTPKPSPRVPVPYSHHDDSQYHQTEYFPLMPVAPSPAAMSASAHDQRMALPHAPHSIAVLNTGQLPPLPSPGGTRRNLHHVRPRNPRHNTASPTSLTGGIPSSATSSRPPNRPRHDSSASEAKNSATSNNPIPTPPAVSDPMTRQTSNPPTPRIDSPQPVKQKRRKKPQIEAPSLPAGLLDGSVPPINVLIVEDNIINLRVLGAFMQRLKVRWQRAMNGKEAVTKWKAGGFHLVLMDIQLPVMNGLEATKEIRRLERVNSIGVFSSGSSEAPNHRVEQGQVGVLDADDRLGVDKGLFKSPVIIVALTASSLQSDRHEALAAGCNDFLTKPVNFVWLERKVKEWGCMQALIDFDGWRRWKDFADKSESMDPKSKMSASFSSIAPQKKSSTSISSLSPTLAANPPDGANGAPPAKKDEERKSKRKSLGVIPPPALQEENENGTPDAETAS